MNSYLDAVYPQYGRLWRGISMQMQRTPLQIAMAKFEIVKVVEADPRTDLPLYIATPSAAVHARRRTFSVTPEILFERLWSWITAPTRSASFNLDDLSARCLNRIKWKYFDCDDPQNARKGEAYADYLTCFQEFLPYKTAANNFFHNVDPHFQIKLGIARVFPVRLPLWVGAPGILGTWSSYDSEPAIKWHDALDLEWSEFQVSNSHLPGEEIAPLFLNRIVNSKIDEP
jgi:hypothetical protein